MDKSILRNIAGCKIGIHRRPFCGDNFIYKKFQEIVPGNSLLILSQYNTGL